MPVNARALNALRDSNGTNAVIIYHISYQNTSVLFENIVIFIKKRNS